MKSITLDNGSGIACTAFEGQSVGNVQEVSGLGEFILSFEEDAETNTVVYGTSNDITFCKGKTYEYLRGTIWDCDNRGCEKRVDANVSLPCCQGVEILCYIDPVDSSYCPGDCYISTSLTLKDDNTAAFECLEGKPYWDGFFTPLDARTLPIDPNDPREVEEEQQEIEDIRNQQFSSTVQPVVFSNDRRGILLLEALQFAANSCGLQFCSSILTQDPYDKLVILHTELGGLRYFEGFNTPGQNIFEILDLLKPKFKAEYKIIENKLFFEDEEFFDQVAHIFSLEEFDYDKEPCFQYVKPENDDNCAHGKFQYQSIDRGEATSEFFQEAYSEYYEWNDPPVPGRKGTCEVTFETTGAEFYEDGRINVSGSDHPTLVIWNGASRTDARVIHDAECGYNYPLHLTENSTCGNLHSNFLYRCNPSERNLCEIELTESLTLFPKDFCKVYDILRRHKTNIGIQTDCGLVKPKKIDINFSQQSVTFNELAGI